MFPVDILLNSIFMAYFANSHCPVLITEDLNQLQIKANTAILSINIEYSNYSVFENIFNSIGCQEFVLDVENPATVFKYIEGQMQLHKDRFNRRRYVFLTRSDQRESGFEVFDTQEINYVSDVLLIMKEKATEKNESKFWNRSEEIFSLWTHRYIGQTGNNQAYKLDTWFSHNESFLFNNNLFPDKLKDQAGRNLKAAVFSYEPYVIAEPQTNGTYLYMGSEMVTMLTFAEYHNMTLVPVINELDYWGEIWENRSGNGLMGNLVEDNADLGAAALYTWESAYKFLDISKPTVRTGITCLVPAPKLAAGWLTPVHVFGVRTWIAVMGTFVMIVLILFLLGNVQPNKNTNYERQKLGNKARIFGKAIISASKPLLLQNVTENEIVEGLLGRYLMGLVFMTALVLSTTYDSGLATIMTIPRYGNPINTLDDFVSSGLHWGATQDAWITSIQDAKEPNLIKVVSRFLATTEENLRSYSKTGRFAFSVERLPHENYAVGDYIKEDVIQNFHLMTEDFYWEFCVVMMRKSSILLPYVDIFVLKVSEAGLISFWQNMAATQYMNQYVQKAVKFLYYHQKERDIVKLKMIHVQGAFGILLIGNGMAFVVFLMELIYRRLCDISV